MDQPTFADPRSWPRAGSGIPGQEAQDPPGTFPGAYGRPHSMAVAGGPTPSLLLQGGKGTPSLSAVRHVESPLRPSLLQSQRPRHGGPPLSRRQALLYESEPVRRFAGLKLRAPCPTRPPSSTPVICWSSTAWGRAFWWRSTPTWSPRY